MTDMIGAAYLLFGLYVAGRTFVYLNDETVKSGEDLGAVAIICVFAVFLWPVALGIRSGKKGQSHD